MNCNCVANNLHASDIYNDERRIKLRAEYKNHMSRSVLHTIVTADPYLISLFLGRQQFLYVFLIALFQWNHKTKKKQFAEYNTNRPCRAETQTTDGNQESEIRASEQCF